MKSNHFLESGLQHALLDLRSLLRVIQLRYTTAKWFIENSGTSCSLTFYLIMTPRGRKNSMFVSHVLARW